MKAIIDNKVEDDKGFPERCEEHGLYLYLNGKVRTCKLGCVYQ